MTIAIDFLRIDWKKVARGFAISLFDWCWTDSKASPATEVQFETPAGPCPPFRTAQEGLCRTLPKLTSLTSLISLNSISSIV